MKQKTRIEEAQLSAQIVAAIQEGNTEKIRGLWKDLGPAANGAEVQRDVGFLLTCGGNRKKIEFLATLCHTKTLEHMIEGNWRFWAPLGEELNRRQKLETARALRDSGEELEP